MICASLVFIVQKNSNNICVTFRLITYCRILTLHSHHKCYDTSKVSCESGVILHNVETHRDNITDYREHMVNDGCVPFNCTLSHDNVTVKLPV